MIGTELPALATSLQVQSVQVIVLRTDVDDFTADGRSGANAVQCFEAPYLSAAPGAVAAGKALVAQLGGGVSDAQVDVTVDALVARWASDEAEEGIAAFFEKRAARWVE